MERIKFDNGVKEYRLGSGGVLRFNPGDPNLYARFLEAVERISLVEKEMVNAADREEPTGAALVKLLQEADQKMKNILSWVFGQDNDFDKILGGVNLLAVGANGNRVVTNLFEVLQPILIAGAESCAKEKVEQALGKAKARRNSP